MSLVERAMAKFRTDVPDQDTVEYPLSPDSTSVTPGLEKVSVDIATSSRAISLHLPTLTSAGLIAEPQDARRLADQYRRIKRPILERIQVLTKDKSPAARLVMLTSALPGDGKTFSSFNLARSIARERDFCVLLVDADVAKPHISSVLGVHRQAGLLDLLADSTLDPETLVLTTDIPGLAVLPAGTRQESATELLTSARMTEVTRQLVARDPRRIVLFDSPPVLLSSESRAVAQIAGQIVMIVRAGATPQEAVLEAIGHIGADKLTGLVLNQCDIVASGANYGYGNYGEDFAAANE